MSVNWGDKLFIRLFYLEDIELLVCSLHAHNVSACLLLVIPGTTAWQEVPNKDIQYRSISKAHEKCLPEPKLVELQKLKDALMSARMA